MRKLRRAIFCYCLLRACATPAAFARVRRGLWRWMISLYPARRSGGGLITIGSDAREQIADWIMGEMLAHPMDFDVVIKILTGDEYFERNKKDVARLKRETGKLVTELWDTDPIFTRYPHLRTLARNREFEKMWAAMKQKTK